MSAARTEKQQNATILKTIDRLLRGTCAVAVSALAVNAATSHVSAQTALEPIVIEGTNVALTPVDEKTVGSAVSVVTGKQLRQRQIRHAADALRTVPGVSVSRTGSFGGFSQVRIRGGEGNQTLVLIDGVPVNDTTNGEFDFAGLLTEDIERIEVIRGPQSGLFGSNALSGVINIVTHSGKGPPRVHVTAEGGQFNTRMLAASVRGGNERAEGAVSVVNRDTDGFNIAKNGFEDDGSGQFNLHAKGGIWVTEFLRIEGFVRKTDNEAEIDNFGAPPGATPGSFAGPVDAIGPMSNTYLWTHNLAAKLELFDGDWTTKVYTNGNRTDQTNISPTFGDSFNLSERDRIGVLSNVELSTPAMFDAEHNFTALFETEDEFFTPSSDRIERSRDKESIVGEYRVAFAETVFLNASVRHDDSSVFEDFTTYRVVGAALIHSTGTKLHASVGTGVLFPSMFEQFGFVPTRFVSNPNLSPEESEGWDAGIEQSFLNDSLIIDVTYFDQNLTNKIASERVPGTFLSTSVNLPGESTRDGIEVTVRALPFAGLEITGAYTYLNAEDPDGLEEVRRPPHSGSINATYRFDEDRALVSLGVIYNGEREENAFDAFTFARSRVTLDEYTVVRLAAQYDITPYARIFGRVDNLFDEDYEEVFGYSTPEIAAYGGVRFTIGGEEALDDSELDG